MVRSARNRARQAEGHCRGLAHRLSNEPTAELDDAELAHKVESILFRDPSAPKGKININAESGRVFLRGQVDGHELVLELERAVRQIPGVRDVENLLHLPGTPAPHVRSEALLEK
jgi:osmotically-inducible protein OsmY